MLDGTALLSIQSSQVILDRVACWDGTTPLEVGG
jgi:hypothetical protein